MKSMKISIYVLLKRRDSMGGSWIAFSLIFGRKLKKALSLTPSTDRARCGKPVHASHVKILMDTLSPKKNSSWTFMISYG